MTPEPVGSSRPNPGAPTAPVFATLRADHRRVLARMRGLERVLVARKGPRPQPARATGRRPVPQPDTALRAFVEWLSHQFGTHMATEDEVLFPALALALPSGHDFVAPLKAEHVELRLMLESLRSTLERASDPLREERLRVEARDLFELLRIHIRKEEALVFGIAERVLAPQVLDQLAARRELGATPPIRTPIPRLKGPSL